MKTYNDVTIPSMIYGTAWKKDDTARLTELAVNAGFRAIDTANQLKHYDERLVGEALRRLYQDGYKRESLFLQTKFTSIDGQDHRLPYDPSADLTTQVAQSLDSSLQHLHTDHVDSYVLHGPFSRGRLSDADWEVWAAIEAAHNDEKARVIGVSNFTAAQLEALCGKAAVKPMVVQNRCYAVTGWDREVRAICKANGIVYEGFSLLTANGMELSTPTVRNIARRLGATIPQTVFRFAMHVGILPLTGTTNLQHMQEDLKAEDFELTAEEIEAIESISG